MKIILKKLTGSKKELEFKNKEELFNFVFETLEGGDIPTGIRKMNISELIESLPYCEYIRLK